MMAKAALGLGDAATPRSTKLSWVSGIGWLVAGSAACEEPSRWRRAISWLSSMGSGRGAAAPDILLASLTGGAIICAGGGITSQVIRAALLASRATATPLASSGKRV